MLRKWYEKHRDWHIHVVRPTVIFGERNRGNVYNLLHHISQGKFLMVDDGNNKKSMAYVGLPPNLIQRRLWRQDLLHLIRCEKVWRAHCGLSSWKKRQR